MKPRHRKLCACGKVHSATLDEARKARAEIWAERGGQIEVRYYTCPYASVHWTRMLEPI